ncbi:toll/interleukin-1 receptor domain-containing protein [Ethanoligenens sp.]|uniref:toll/interleukin-1 receptor domain-containing protein n=1 Tax=Ethanoligenens sp. TaxID=2099655 RepID=UPI0039E8C58A
MSEKYPPPISDEALEVIYNRFCLDPAKHVYQVPFSEFSYGRDSKILSCIKWRLELLFEANGLAVISALDYNNSEIIICKEGEMMSIPYRYTLKIPYESRSTYLPAIKKLSEFSSEYARLFVNNNPYQLEAYLVIESSKNQVEIEQIIKKYSMERIFDKGLMEFIIEMGNRRWDSVSLPTRDGLLELVYASQFHFSEKEYLENKGYHPEITVQRKKLFISYCHVNKASVENITSAMKSHGMYFWLDEQEIDAGDDILERVQNGIRESDLAIIFISRATVEAMFARHELSTIWKAFIQKRKAWFIVRLDEVNPEDILFGLSDYKYYDFFESNSVDDLLEAINRKINKL